MMYSMADHMLVKYRIPRQATYNYRKQFLKSRLEKLTLRQKNIKNVEDFMDYRGNNALIELKEVERLIFWNEWIHRQKDYSSSSHN